VVILSKSDSPTKASTTAGLGPRGAFVSVGF